MFHSLDSFSIFFFISLAVILAAIWNEEKLTALEKKHTKRKERQRK